MPDLTPDQDCDRAHEHLKAAMALIDAEFRAPGLKDLRARLIERGTVACANARLRRGADMRADLQVMLDAALEIPLGQADETSVLRLRRLIQTALSEAAEPDV